MNKYIILLAASVLLSCNPTKKVAVTKVVKEVVPEPLLVELTLDEKYDAFVWKKGEYLDVSGKITNKSTVPITILSPKSSYQVDTDYFGVHFMEDFEGMECLFEVSEDDASRTTNEFVTILPNESNRFYISGRSYFLNYCNTGDSTSEEIELNVIYNYYETKHDYTSESYFIANTYKTEINEKDEERIQTSLNYLNTSSRFQKMSKEDKEKYLVQREKSLRAELIKATPEEQAVMIEKYNSLFGRKLESNTIIIKVEQ